MLLPTSNCYCADMSHGRCVHCVELVEREEERRVCESWNWNCNARECAKDARRREWSQGRLKSAMERFGFSKANVSDVLQEFERDE